MKKKKKKINNKKKTMNTRIYLAAIAALTIGPAATGLSGDKPLCHVPQFIQHDRSALTSIAERLSVDVSPLGEISSGSYEWSMAYVTHSFSGTWEQMVAMVPEKIERTVRTARAVPRAIAAVAAKPAGIKQAKRVTPAVGAGKKKKADESFGEFEVVSNNELSDVRGGFMTSNGMILDVGLATQTIVNGILVESTELSPEALKNADPSVLRTLVRVQDGSATTQKLNLTDVPEILNVIQSDASNVQIDHLTSLNIDVQNAANFAVQTQTPGLNHTAIMTLR